jgi:hypothetical protein
MKTGNAIILMTAVILLVFVGIVAAEDFMMPQELQEKQTVIANNSTDNGTHSEDVKRHVPPRGVMQKAILLIWDPFGHAPIDNAGFKIYNGALWYQYPDGSWIQVAFLNNNKQVTHIQVWNQNIVKDITNNYQTTENVTITMVEEPPTYELGQSKTNDNTTSNNNANNPNNNAEKINTTINLGNQKLTNDTNSTITGTLVDQNGTAISNAEVTITVNGQSHTEITDSNGKFSYEYNTQSSDLTIGSNSMQVSYSGNETYNGASKSITITLEGVEEEVTNDTNNTTKTEKQTSSSSSSSSSSSNQKIDNSRDTYSSEEYYDDEEYYADYYYY